MVISTVDLIASFPGSTPQIWGVEPGNEDSARKAGEWSLGTRTVREKLGSGAWERGQCEKIWGVELGNEDSARKAGEWSLGTKLVW